MYVFTSAHRYVYKAVHFLKIIHHIYVILYSYCHMSIFQSDQADTGCFFKYSAFRSFLRIFPEAVLGICWRNSTPPTRCLCAESAVATYSWGDARCKERLKNEKIAS